MNSGALTGIRVLDLGRLLAAPWAAQILEDLGAEVIKVERPGTGDLAREVGPGFLTDRQGRKTDEASLYLSGNRNKRSITVDVGSAEGQEIIRLLVGRSDVMVENFVPGTLARYGLDYASLRVINPRLIYCSLSGYGQDGPGATRPGIDGVLQAYSGLMSVTGRPDGEPGAGPMRIGPSTVDAAAGAYAAAGIMAALLYRDRVSGQGQQVDISLLNTAIAAQAHYMTDYLLTGSAPKRKGNGVGPTGRVYYCLDGPILLSARRDSEFRDLCALLGAPELADDERFTSAESRIQHSPELITLLEPLFFKREKAHVIDALQRARITGAVVQDYEEVFADPQVQHQGARVDVPHPLSASGTAPGVANPIRLSETPSQYVRHPPTLGEHTDEILRELLGYDDPTIDRLRSQGSI